MAAARADGDVQAVISRVRERFAAGAPRVAPPVSPTRQGQAQSQPKNQAGRSSRDAYPLGAFATVDEAVDAAFEAQKSFAAMGLDRRFRVVEAMRARMLEQGEYLARAAHAETGLGRIADKILKNRLVTTKTPGPEDLEPQVVTGDHGQMLTEYAPFGVIGSITPTTNPTSTVINNTIAMVAAGNSVVFNAHPGAQRVSAENVGMLNEAIAEAGGPKTLATCIAEPTIESAQDLMSHPKIRLLLVTGGPGVVKEALKTDKRAITAGPGNPPVLVDDSADISHAGRSIVQGASFDNNMVCTDEKEVFVVDAVADDLVKAMAANGAQVLRDHELRKLERAIFEELGPAGKPGRINRKWVGQDAAKILAEIGVSAGDEIRLVVAEVPREHSLVWTEQMMPVLPVVRVRDVEEGIQLSVTAEHGFRHTASVYSRNVDVITEMARRMNCSIFVANCSNFAGLGQMGEGFSSFSIATPTGEGLSRPRTFSRIRRLTVVGSLRIV